MCINLSFDIFPSARSGPSARSVGLCSKLNFHRVHNLIMPKPVWDVSHGWWCQVAQKVRRAIVYLDGGMAELLHWSGGMGLLLQAGALDVRDFSSFESGEAGQQKAVFLVSSALTGVTESIIRDIVTGSSFQYVVLFTTISPLLHPSDAGGGDRAGEDWEGFWEDKLLQWMGNMVSLSSLCSSQSSLYIALRQSSLYIALRRV
ncbi:sec1 family domain-containing protein 2-like [Plakobranchus ocellatus]|uniref:Sec1 family domain-containing protein 2-like n=1 Tax=Plakobranchus ocellatus TaxID=259542 RepID=A0AAV4CM77_9GAST|nr:sec1 family domain-containing protein 2-like [Plakobranchus ocellatus]